MTAPRLDISILPGLLAICRLERDAHVPEWAVEGGFCSVTRTSDELSIVCRQDGVPPETKSDRGWRLLKVEGPLDLGLTGVLASLVEPLARAGIPVFAVSTYDTDYLLVKEGDVAGAVEALAGEGHHIRL